MDSVGLISEALEYIEANLTQDMKTQDIARAIHCSKSSLEKLFRFVTHMSIKEYSVRRRMSLAAKDMAQEPDVPFLDIAVKYGYGSNEAFCRAFKSVWQVNPSAYRKNPSRFELFPALLLDRELMEDEKMNGTKKVDISELYDFVKARKNCYIVAVDIKNMIGFNEIAYEAGDIAILTAAKRLEGACGSEDIVFRTGADEFAAITGSEEVGYAEKLVKEILSHNGESICYREREIPLTLYATCYKTGSKVLRYAEFFEEMHEEIIKSKYLMDENSKISAGPETAEER